MSELERAGQGGGETDPPGAPIDLIAATMQEVAAIASPRIAPEHAAPKAETPMAEPPKSEPLKPETPMSEPPVAEPSNGGLAGPPPELKAERADPLQAELKAELASRAELRVPEPPKPELSGIDDRLTARLDADLPTAQMPRAEPFRVATFKADIGAGTAETATSPKGGKDDGEVRRLTREHLLVTPRERGFSSRTTEPTPKAAARGAGKGRGGAMAAMLALGVAAGAAGGALATVGLKHLTKTTAAPPAPPAASARDASIARIDAEVAALKAGLEQTTKASLGQFNKTSERLDRIEKAQAEPAAKLAKLSEALDKLRAAPTPALAAAKQPADQSAPPAAAQGQPTPQATPGVPKSDTGKSDTAKSDTAKSDTAKSDTAKSDTAKSDTGRLPTVDGWVLREVGHGAALIESRQGLYEVYAGDSVPGLGHVDVIRRQDGRWVVVTSKGLIVQR